MAEGAAVAAVESEAPQTSQIESPLGGMQKSVHSTTEPREKTAPEVKAKDEKNKKARAWLRKKMDARQAEAAKHGEVLDRAAPNEPSPDSDPGDEDDGKGEVAEKPARARKAKQEPADPLSHLDVGLVRAAREAGFEDEEIAGYDDKSLTHTLGVAMRRLRSQSEPEESESPTKRKASKPDEDEYKIEIDRETTHEPVVKAFEGLVSRMNADRKADRERIASLEKEINAGREEKRTATRQKEVTDFTNTFKGIIEANPKLKTVFGSGDPADMTAAERKAATKVVEATFMNRRGYEMTPGSRIPPMDELLARHVTFEYPHLINPKGQWTGKTKEQRARERADELVDLPASDGRGKGIPEKGSAAAKSWIADWMGQNGLRQR